MIMDDELGKVLKGAVVFHICPEGLSKTTETPVRIAYFQAKS
jgi:hypothetical protein